MVRRVKAYLLNLKVVTDEDQLDAMSLECEPLITSGTIYKILIGTFFYPNSETSFIIL